jgi:hypothetical protein
MNSQHLTKQKEHVFLMLIKALRLGQFFFNPGNQKKKKKKLTLRKIMGSQHEKNKNNGCWFINVLKQ